MPRNNWKNKDERLHKAEAHNRYMEENYGSEIRYSIENSEVIRNIAHKTGTGNPVIKVLDTDTVSAAFGYYGEKQPQDHKVTVLNFASYKHPGGGYMSGAVAQEEALCHESFLYNVLSAFGDYYEQNKTDLNLGMYRNAAIYSPDVVFEHDGKAEKLNVITCAAPNYSVGLRYGKFGREENTKALLSRIEFIRDIAETKGSDLLVLGAYGCGVFRQDPTETAEIFKTTFERSDIPVIFFAVPGGKNLEAFVKVFGE